MGAGGKKAKGGRQELLRKVDWLQLPREKVSSAVSLVPMERAT